jgi:hypothetical protein
MTYGQSTGALMGWLTGLLKSYRRISAHLGQANGRVPASSTPDERGDGGAGAGVPAHDPGMATRRSPPRTRGRRRPVEHTTAGTSYT